jgi:hypothetical protein
MMRTPSVQTLLAAACLFEASLVSFAFSQAAPPPDPLRPPLATQPSDTPVPGDVPTKPRPDESLSDQLSRSHGVLHPPSGTDPEIRKPTPSTGSQMPVIPPPGTPGGRQDTQPK